MILPPMRYKDYCWPHNPETYSVTCRRRVAALEAPGGGICTQDLGAACRVMRGEGEFAGEGAYEEFLRLTGVFETAGPGMLIHPVWPASPAHFVSLLLRQEPLPDYVRYSFEFWEADAGGAGVTVVQTDGTGAAPAPPAQNGQAVWHTVKKGDTLWGIARSYGVTLQSLIAGNPQIKNPNLIYPGNQVRVK